MIDYKSVDFKRFQDSIQFLREAYPDESLFTVLTEGLRYGYVSGFPGWESIVATSSERYRREKETPTHQSEFLQILKLVDAGARMYVSSYLERDAEIEFLYIARELAELVSKWRGTGLFPLRRCHSGSLLIDLKVLCGRDLPGLSPVGELIRGRLRTSALLLEEVLSNGSQASYVNLKSQLDPGFELPPSVDSHSEPIYSVFLDLKQGIVQFLKSKQLELICPLSYQERFDGRFHEVAQGSSVDPGSVVVKVEQYGLRYQDQVIVKARVVCGDALELFQASGPLQVPVDVDDPDDEPRIRPNF